MMMLTFKLIHFGVWTSYYISTKLVRILATYTTLAQFTNIEATKYELATVVYLQPLGFEISTKQPGQELCYLNILMVLRHN